MCPRLTSIASTVERFKEWPVIRPEITYLLSQTEGAGRVQIGASASARLIASSRADVQSKSKGDEDGLFSSRSKEASCCLIHSSRSSASWTTANDKSRTPPDLSITPTATMGSIMT
jgi:hypothetical protein